jgi:hypothetical protein
MREDLVGNPSRPLNKGTGFDEALYDYFGWYVKSKVV